MSCNSICLVGALSPVKGGFFFMSMRGFHPRPNIFLSGHEVIQPNHNRPVHEYECVWQRQQSFHAARLLSSGTKISGTRSRVDTKWPAAANKYQAPCSEKNNAYSPRNMNAFETNSASNAHGTTSRPILCDANCSQIGLRHGKRTCGS